jgi:ligand-binding sensor domain-containing protein/signal transduction histidine kinase
MKNCITFFILFLLVITNICYPQSSMKFKHFTSETGAPQSPVNTIFQDNTGFIWLGSTDGLFIYDGYEFTSYQNDPRDPHSLSDNWIRAIFQDDKGHYWIGTKAGLNKLVIIRDEITGETKEGFYCFINDPQDSFSISSNDIRTIFQDSEKNIWVGTSSGLNLIISEKRESGKNKLKFKRFINNPLNPFSLSHNNISCFTEDKDGYIYVGTMGGGINVFNSNKEVIKIFKNDPANSLSLRSNYIVTLYFDSNDRLLAGTYGGGLSMYDKNKNGFIHFVNDPSNYQSLSDDKVYSILEDEDGIFWVATFGKGISRFNSQKGIFENFKNDLHNQNSLNNYFVRKILLDNSRLLWIGTNNGLSVVDLKPAKFFHLYNDKSQKPVISDNYILSVIKDKNEIIWLGTNKGLDRIDREKGIIKSYKIDHNNPKSGEGFIYSLCEDKTGNIWLGTFGGGIYKFSPGNGKLVQYRHNPDDVNSLIDNRVTRSLFLDSGDLLVGTVTGISRFNPETGKSRRYIVSEEDSAMLAGKWVQVIMKDSDNDIWIGTTTGLFYLNQETGRCKKIPDDKKNINSLSDDRINSLFEDKTGKIWIGTDNGLNRYDKETGRNTTFFRKDGLPNNIITNVTGDDSGVLWITTSRGLTFYNPEINQFRNFDPDDGLQGYEFNSGAFFKANDDEIFIGGTNGLNWFSPSKLKDNPFKPEIAFTSFKKYDKVIETAVKLSLLEKIELSFNDSYFSFEFTSLDFTNPRKNNFAYKLEGFDDEWIYNNNRRFANYTNISPGKYIFRVKASNNDNVWNEEGISLLVIIHPPFYRTIGAYIVYIFIFVFALAALRRYELNKRKKKEEENLRKEREAAKIKEMQLRAEASEYKAQVIEKEKEIEKAQMRNRIASDLHDEIGSNLSSITILSELAKKKRADNGELIRHMDEINLAAKASSESIRDIVWLINPDSDQLKNLISKMKETANFMLEGIKYEIETSEFDPDEKINPDIRRNVYLIYKEILNNIIRHSMARYVKLGFRKDNGNLIIYVEDDGIGFDINFVKAGNGLRNLNYRAAEIKGKLTIDSQKGSGTKIVLVIEKITG